jgi:hypothetical protein
MGTDLSRPCKEVRDGRSDGVSSGSLGKTSEMDWEAKRGTTKDPPGAAVFGVVVEAERTPPVRRPARREARGFGGGAVVIAIEIGIDR